MGLSIANNVASLTAQENLGRTSANVGNALERLSGGPPVNRGGDGPAAVYTPSSGTPTAGTYSRPSGGTLANKLEDLSNALKITRGADGPAALVVSEEQRARIADLRTALDAVNTSATTPETGESARREVEDLVQQARDLALASAG